MLLFTNRQADACAVVEVAFDAARRRRHATHVDTPFERRMYPYVLNNWLICQVRLRCRFFYFEVIHVLGE